MGWDLLHNLFQPLSYNSICQVGSHGPWTWIQIIHTITMYFQTFDSTHIEGNEYISHNADTNTHTPPHTHTIAGSNPQKRLHDTLIRNSYFWKASQYFTFVPIQRSLPEWSLNEICILGLCYGLSCITSEFKCESPNPPCDWIKERAFKEGIKVKWSHKHGTSIL